MRSDAVEHELKSLRELATLHETETMMYFIKAVQPHPAKPKTECPDTAASSNNQSSQSSKIKNPEEERVESNRQALVKKGNPARAQAEAEVTLNEACKWLTEIATTRDTNDMKYKAAVKNHAAATKELKHKQDNAERQRKFQKNRYQRLCRYARRMAVTERLFIFMKR